MNENTLITTINEEYRNHPFIQKLCDQDAFNSSCSFEIKLEGKWMADNVGQMCPTIKQWKLVTLSATQNFHSLILKQIRNICFPFLQKLNVSFNNIQSIEGLSRMQAPFLISLIISKNNVHQVSDLYKTYWKNISELDMSNNQINEAKILSKMLIQDKEKLQLKVDLRKEFPEQGCDTRWVIKLQSNRIDIIIGKNFTKENKIKERELKKYSKRKFKDIRLFRIVS